MEDYIIWNAVREEEKAMRQRRREMLAYEPHSESSESFRQMTRDGAELAQTAIEGVKNFSSWLSNFIEPPIPLPESMRIGQQQVKLCGGKALVSDHKYSGRWDFGCALQDQLVPAVHFVLADDSIPDKLAALKAIKHQHPSWLSAKGPAGESALFTAIWFGKVECALWLAENTDFDPHELISSDGSDFTLFDALLLKSAPFEGVQRLAIALVDKISREDWALNLCNLINKYLRAKDQENNFGGPGVLATRQFISKLVDDICKRREALEKKRSVDDDARAKDVAKENDGWEVGSADFVEVDEPDAAVVVGGWGAPSTVSWNTQEQELAEREAVDGDSETFDEETEAASLNQKFGSVLVFSSESELPGDPTISANTDDEQNRRSKKSSSGSWVSVS